MPQRSGCPLATHAQGFPREVADRLESAIARAVLALLRHDERLVDQRCEEVQHVVGCQGFHAAHLLGRFEIEASGEHAQAIEQDLLVRLQQVIRPRDQGAQRLLALEDHPPATGEQLEAVAQARVDVGEREGAHACRGELQREWYPFEPRHDLGHRRRFPLAKLECRLVRARAIDEEAYGIRLSQRVDRRAPVRNR